MVPGQPEIAPSCVRVNVFGRIEGSGERIEGSGERAHRVPCGAGLRLPREASLFIGIKNRKSSRTRTC